MVTQVSDTPKQRLLESAIAIFAEKGFASAPVRDICRQAGVNVAAVNYYFGDKERLYVEAVKHAHFCMINTVPMPQWGPDVTPKRKLRDFITVMVARMFREPNPHATQLFMREMAHPTAAVAELVRDVIRPMAETLKAMLADLMPHSTEAERYLFGFSVVGQCVFYKQNRPVVRLLLGDDLHEKLTAQQVADHIYGVMIAALEAR